MTRQYKLLENIETAFDDVVTSSQRLVDIYRNHQAAAWALHSPSPDADWLEHALLDFWYVDAQDGRVTKPYVGLVAASSEVLAAVAQVNCAKSEFSRVLAEIKANDKPLVAELKASLPKRHSFLGEHLAGSGLARLHLKQCWRHIPMAESPLQRVRMSWYTSGRSIRKVTVPEAERMLMSFDTEAPHIQIQLRALAGIPSGEPLAQVQNQAPVMRANLFYQDPLPDGRTRRAMNVALPLFIPSDDGQLPNHNQPAPFPPEQRTRKLRNDARLETDPYLPSLRIYRYRSEAA